LLWSVEQLQELFDPDGFQKKMGTDAHRVLVEDVVVEAGQHDGDDIGRGGFGPDHKLQPIECAKPDVGHEHLDATSSEAFLCGLEVVERLDLEAGTAQEVSQQPQNTCVVVNDNGKASRASGESSARCLR
jgi:hypothetical protein